MTHDDGPSSRTTATSARGAGSRRPRAESIARDHRRSRPKASVGQRRHRPSLAIVPTPRVHDEHRRREEAHAPSLMHVATRFFTLDMNDTLSLEKEYGGRGLEQASFEPLNAEMSTKYGCRRKAFILSSVYHALDRSIRTIRRARPASRIAGTPSRGPARHALSGSPSYAPRPSPCPKGSPPGRPSCPSLSPSPSLV